MRTTALLLILLTGAAHEAAPAVAADRRAPCTGDRFATDGVGSLTERAHARRVVLCVFWHVVRGQRDHALYVADRESSFDDEAYNPSGASGLFQHMARYWRGRARALPLRWFPNRAHVGPFNARANAWAAALMVRRSGWGPWS